MGYREMFEEMEKIVEQCDDVAYFAGDMDRLIDALDGEEEEAMEFRMAFSDLSAKATELMDQIYSVSEEEYDDCTVAIIGQRYRMVGYDGFEEDYFSLTGYEEGLAETEAGKRLMRKTKKEMIDMIGHAVGVLLAFLDLRQQYDYLKATMDILTDSNHSILKQIREIETAYEKVGAVKYPAKKDIEAFDRMTALLPERMWVE
jgi:hypothetical protein